MATVKPFRGLRPPRDIAAALSCLPYDVMNSAEAAQMADGNAVSLLHVTRAEIDCPLDTDVHSAEVYNMAAANFARFKADGWLRPDPSPCYYVYAQTMNGRTQYGIVGAAACEDYFSGVIRKHELTRPDKEEDRMALTRYLNANIEPVFFAYKAVPEIDAIVADTVRQTPEYDFTAADGFGHQLWVIRDAEVNRRIEHLFTSKVPFTYVADGHHRTAAAARIGQERKATNPNHTGTEEYNFFMAVHFPDNHLQIMDYNRLLRDLNGLTPTEFLQKLAEKFIILKRTTAPVAPTQPRQFALYVQGEWTLLKARPEIVDDSDPISRLDVTLLSRHLLEPLLGIADLRTSQRIDFVGGIRGLDELKRRVDSGEMKAAIALYPVSMQQLTDIADSGNIMPPKTTWFEPKLRSGLVIHEI
ncbi:MAG: DUF1015 family protein [Bacteroidales bacterium]|jgi:uncharacterized protein (DUF1015 family)|nr:DUF1015 family protein [Bacteroidales bacterium]